MKTLFYYISERIKVEPSDILCKVTKDEEIMIGKRPTKMKNNLEKLKENINFTEVEAAVSQ